MSTDTGKGKILSEKTLTMISHFLCGLDGISTKAGSQLFLMLLKGYAETPPDSYKVITWLRIQILEYTYCALDHIFSDNTLK